MIKTHKITQTPGVWWSYSVVAKHYAQVEYLLNEEQVEAKITTEKLTKKNMHVTIEKNTKSYVRDINKNQHQPKREIT